MGKKRAFISFEVKEADVTVTEYLRYAGIISVEGGGHTGGIHIPYEIQRHFDRENIIITMECPKGLDQDRWIDMNTKRLRSFVV